MNSELEDSEEIRSTFRDDVRRLIARYCIKPKETREIVKAVQKDKQWYLETVERKVSDDLAELESLGLMKYSDDKWVTKPEAIRILKRYFGG